MAEEDVWLVGPALQACVEASVQTQARWASSPGHYNDTPLICASRRTCV